jgi:hypothetical protein
MGDFSMPWIVLVVVVLVLLFGTFLATLILRTSCGMFGEEQPSYKRAFLMLILITIPVALCFEVMGYGAALAMHESLKLPAGFSFINWLRLPLGIQWQALGTVPLLKYVPVIVSLCLAGIMMVAWIQCTFRKGLLIIAVQWLFNGLALAILAQVGMFSLATYDRMVGLPPDVKEYLTGQHVGAAAAGDTAKNPHGPPPRDGGKFHNLKENSKAHAKQESTNQDPEKDEKKLSPIATFLSGDSQETVKTWGHSFVEFLDRLRHEADPLIDTIRNHAHPVTQHFPLFLNNFLDNQGGWWILIGLTILVCFLWVKSTIKRIRHLTKKKTRKASDTWNKDLAWPLGGIGEIVHPVEGVQLTVKGSPARLRAVVICPATKETQAPGEHSLDGIFEHIEAGMSRTLIQDQPLVRVWEPTFGGSQAFASLCHNLVTIPGPKGKPTKWVVVAGTVEFGPTDKVHLGLAFQTEKATSLRNLTVDGKTTRWLDVIGTTQILMMQRV